MEGLTEDDFAEKWGHMEGRVDALVPLAQNVMRAALLGIDERLVESLIGPEDEECVTGEDVEFLVDLLTHPAAIDEIVGALA